MCCFVGKVMSQLFNMFSRFVIAFFPRSKGLLISWLPSPSTVIWEPKKIKSVKASTFSPSICNEVIGPEARILVFFFFRCWVSSHLFHSLLLPSSRDSSSSSISPFRVVSSAYLGCWCSMLSFFQMAFFHFSSQN